MPEPIDTLSLTFTFAPGVSEELPAGYGLSSLAEVLDCPDTNDLQLRLSPEQWAEVASSNGTIQLHIADLESAIAKVRAQKTQQTFFDKVALQRRLEALEPAGVASTTQPE